MIRRPRRGKHRQLDGRGRTSVTVLLALVAAGVVVTSVGMSAGRAHDVVAVRTGPSAVPTVDRAAAAPVRECETAVAKARDAVAAARPSYSHWAGHVRAQLDYDAGTATLEQTRERWAATKATADADLAQFATAYGAFEAVRDGCAQQPGQAPGDQDPVMAQCRSEFASVSAAVAAAKAVVDDWAAHVAMMKDKAHIDPAQYGQMWRDMVKAAPTDLARFAQASLDMSDHVDCPRPS